MGLDLGNDGLQDPSTGGHEAQEARRGLGDLAEEFGVGLQAEKEKVVSVTLPFLLSRIEVPWE